MAWPSPVVPPMTTATLPVKSKRFWLIFETFCGFACNPLAHGALKFMISQAKRVRGEQEGICVFYT
jgi:hypothetical protein